MADNGSVLRILIVRIGAMGDVLHGMPAVAGLRKSLPGCRIGWAIEPRWSPLLVASDGEMPLVDRLHLVPTREWKKRPFAWATLRQIAELRRELRSERYDLVVDLQGSIKSSVVGWLAGAKKFVGLRDSRERAATFFYSQKLRPSSISVIDQAVELIAAALGCPIATSEVRLPVDPEAEGWSETLLQDHHHTTSTHPVFLIPQAGWGAKEWGVANYRALARELKASGFGVIVNQAPGTQEPNAIADASGALAVQSTLPQMIALIRRSSLVIGGDTGPVHLAAALGKPVIALFGPTDPARNGPNFPNALVKVLRDPSSITDHRRHAETEAGLKRIRVEEVLAAALAMLNQTKGS